MINSQLLAEPQSAATRRSAKRKGVVEVDDDEPYQTVFSIDDQQDTAAEPAALPPKRAAPKKPARFFHETSAKYSAKVNGTNTDLSPPFEPLLWVPGEDGTWKWERTALPALRKRFETDYWDTSEHRKSYCQLFGKNEDWYLNKKACVNFKVYTGIVKKCEWTQAKGNDSEACGKCIRLFRICARLTRIDGSINLAIYALPSGLRVGKKPDEIEFWCQTWPLSKNIKFQ